MLIAFNSVLVVVCLGSAWTLAYYQRQISDIPRIPLQGVLDRQDDPTKPVNFLLVGSDSTADPERAGSFHADSISILRVDPNEKRVALLSLPRDLWVEIPGKFGLHKINSALNYGSQPGTPDVLKQVIKERFDIPIHHYVQVDFAAFRSLVDELDGVNLWFDRPARDKESGLFVDDAGCLHANGEQALAYARARYYTERQDDGSWAMDATTDIGRIARQQYFLKQAAKKAIARGARNPIELAGLIGIAQRYVKLDDVLTPQMILDIVGHFNSFNPEDLPVYQPFTERLVRAGSGGDGLRLLEGPSQPIFDRFRDRPAEPGPSVEALAVPAPSAPPPSSTPASPGTTLAPPDARSFVPHPPPDAAC